MKRTRNLIRRSLSGFGAEIVVFIGIILTLPGLRLWLGEPLGRLVLRLMR